MKPIINYFEQIIDISFSQTPIIVCCIALLVVFVVILSINNPIINTWSKQFFTFVIIILFIYLLFNSNSNLFSQGKYSLLPPQCKQSSFVDKFLVEIINCNIYNTDSLSFDLLITNKSKPRILYIYAKNTMLFDWYGNQNFAQKVSMGGSSYSSHTYRNIPSNIPIKVSIVFEDTFLEGNIISLLDIKTNYTSVKFNNILFRKTNKTSYTES